MSSKVKFTEEIGTSVTTYLGVLSGEEVISPVTKDVFLRVLVSERKFEFIDKSGNKKIKLNTWPEDRPYAMYLSKELMEVK